MFDVLSFSIGSALNRTLGDGKFDINAVSKLLSLSFGL